MDNDKKVKEDMWWEEQKEYYKSLNQNKEDEKKLDN
jgi:hypothetical protein